jgi:O-antigen/teichoic acid export membrane protein
MSQIRTNIVANYAGTVCTSLMGVLFLPVYTRFVETEAYSLVSVGGY